MNPSPALRNRSRIAAAVLVLNALLMLFPPLYWAASGHGPAFAIAYVVGTPIVALISLFVLFATQREEAQG